MNEANGHEGSARDGGNAAEPDRPTGSFDPEAKPPLADVTVLDLSRLVAGNALTHVLADLGADVIKVERPEGGDDLRHWLVEGVPTYWRVYARNKRSISLDFRKPEGLDILLELVRNADVLVENFLPGKLESFGLGPEVLLAANPTLVVVRVSGWGQTGPFREVPGFGTLVEAMSGFAAMNGYPDRPPTLPPLALADMICGLWGATATMVALREVEQHGNCGQVIDLSLFEPLFATLGPQIANHKLQGRVAPRLGSRSATAAPRNVYRCSDGKYVALSASMQSMVDRLFRTIGREDLIDEPRFATNADRLAHGEELDALIADYIAERDQAANLKLFRDAGVTVGEVCDATDLMDHPYICERGVVVEMPDPTMGAIPMHAVVPRLSLTPGALRRPAPELGEHTDEILESIGKDRNARRKLRDGGVV